MRSDYMTDAELKALNDEMDLEEEMDAQDEELAALDGRRAAEAASKPAAPSKPGHETPASTPKPATPAPTPTPKPTAPKVPAPVALGLGKDGVYRLTRQQLADPEFCWRTEAERKSAKSVEIVRLPK